MPAPPVSIQIEGDRDAGLAYLPRAQQMLDRLLERMAVGGIQTLRDHLDLGDGDYCYAIVTPGLAVLRIVAAEGVGEPVPVAVSQDWRVPDFLSGVVIGGQIFKDTAGTLYCRELLPTEECARLYQLYAGGFDGDPRDSQRLAVFLHEDLQKAVYGGAGYAGAQSGGIQPTLWTGHMRKLVQALLGFGKPMYRSIYSDHRWIVPTEEDAAHAGAVKKVARALAGGYESDVARHGRQIRYDCRWYRTHGLLKASDGAWWLVEISSTRGVVAMPLPVYGATGTAAFRARVEKLNDSAGLALLDEFGAFPTGEGFPRKSTAFDAWARAGRIVTLAPVSAVQPFYNLGPYSSIMGWAFSPDGRQAHNTAHGLAANGMQHSAHWSIALSMGKAQAPRRSAAAAYALAAPYTGQAANQPDQFAAAVWKLRYLDAAQLSEMDSIRGRDGVAAAFAFLDGLVLGPLAAGSATVKLESDGYIYSEGIDGDPLAQAKFPEPLLGYCASATWDLPYIRPDPLPQCDAPVHVYFHGENLHVWRFARNAPRRDAVDENDYEDCMFVGSWSRRQDNGMYLPPGFYANVIDTREDVAADRSLTSIRSEDLGFTSVNVGNIPFTYDCWLTRTKTFRQYVKSEKWSGPRNRSAIAVPFGDRSACYFADFKGYSAYSKTEQWRYQQLGDPNWYYGHWYPPHDPQPVTPECGCLEPRQVFEHQYDPYPCSDYADEGGWASTCDLMDGYKYSRPLPPLPPDTATGTKKQAPWTLRVRLFVDWAESPLLLLDQKGVDEGAGLFDGGSWFWNSPDADGWTAYLYSTHNVLGEADLLQYWARINGGRTLRGSPQHAHMADKDVCCVGVVT